MRGKDYDYVIGIDPGVKTGYAAYNPHTDTLFLKTYMIHEAMQEVKRMAQSGYKVFIRVEDARLRKWFGTAGREVLQGVGSVKRDSKIWEDFLNDEMIPFEMTNPKNSKTKLDWKEFQKITGYLGSSNQHERDAGILVWKY
jgi:hypothetical protein